MFFRILKQSFFQGRKQKILAILTIVLSASLITALLNTSIAVGDKMTKELKAYGANINVLPKSANLSLRVAGVDYNPLKDKVFLSEKDLPFVKDIFWRNNIVGFAPFLKKTASVVGADNQKIVVEGTYFDNVVPIPDESDYKTGVKKIFGYWEVKGKWPKDSSFEALIGINLQKKLKLEVGQSVVLKYANTKKRFKIVGVLNSGSKKDDELISSLHAVQNLFDLKGKLNLIRVSALTVPEDNLSQKARRNPAALNSIEYDSWYCTAYVSSIAHQIEEKIGNSVVKPFWQVASGEGSIIKKIQLLMLVVTIVAIFASAMGISSLMGATIMQRAKEIGLIKALGGNSKEVYTLFLSEAVIVGAIGGVLGFILGCLLSQVISYTIFSSFVPIKFVVFPIIMFISISVALLGSIFPSRMISKLLPREVLYGHK